jgi:hypothetical protein
MGKPGRLVGIPAKAKALFVLAAGVLSMVFVWRVLLAQGNAGMKLKPKLRTPDTFILTMAA